MSDAPDVRTNRSAPRTEIASFFRGNPRLQKAFEELLYDMGVTLPDASQQNAQAAQAASDSAAAALASAATANASADAAQATADQALAEAGAPGTDPGLGLVYAELAQLRSRIAAIEQGTIA